MFLQGIYLAKESGDEDLRDFFGRELPGRALTHFFRVLAGETKAADTDTFIRVFFKDVEPLPEFGFCADTGNLFHVRSKMRKADMVRHERSRQMLRLFHACAIYDKRLRLQDEVNLINPAQGGGMVTPSGMVSMNDMMTSLLGGDEVGSANDGLRHDLAFARAYFPNEEGLDEPDWLGDGEDVPGDALDELSRHVMAVIRTGMQPLSTLPHLQGCTVGSCARVAKTLKRCSRCGIRYCSSFHQASDWKRGHKELCATRAATARRLQQELGDELAGTGKGDT
jgi:MYND finger